MKEKAAKRAKKRDSERDPETLDKLQARLSEITQAFVKEAKGIADMEGIELDVVVRFGISPKQQGE